MSTEEEFVGHWSLTLKNGTVLDNLDLKRNQFTSETLIDRTIFTKENISEMIVDCDEELKEEMGDNVEEYCMEHEISYFPGTILTNVFMDAFWDYTKRDDDSKGCAFSFMYKTPQMMIRERMTAAEDNIETTSEDMTDVQEALVDIYEMIIGE